MLQPANTNLHAIGMPGWVGVSSGFPQLPSLNFLNAHRAHGRDIEESGELLSTHWLHRNHLNRVIGVEGVGPVRWFIKIFRHALQLPG